MVFTRLAALSARVSNAQINHKPVSSAVLANNQSCFSIFIWEICNLTAELENGLLVPPYCQAQKNTQAQMGKVGRDIRDPPVIGGLSC